nr:MAG TPA: rhomboid family protein-like protein [Bacteriophage sp.]
MQNSVCAVRSAIEQVGGSVGFSAERVINAANLGDMNIIQALKDCCCQTQQNIIKMGYEQ